jgi:hypothetical protein
VPPDAHTRAATRRPYTSPTRTKPPAVRRTGGATGGFAKQGHRPATVAALLAARCDMYRRALGPESFSVPRDDRPLTTLCENLWRPSTSPARDVRRQLEFGFSQHSKLIESTPHVRSILDGVLQDPQATSAARRRGSLRQVHSAAELGAGHAARPSREALGSRHRRRASRSSRESAEPKPQPRPLRRGHSLATIGGVAALGSSAQGSRHPHGGEARAGNPEWYDQEAEGAQPRPARAFGPLRAWTASTRWPPSRCTRPTAW